MSAVTNDEFPSVKLVIPARPRFLRLARLTAAGIGTDLGFSLQDIEDLRVAVDEACACLMQDCVDGTHKSVHHLELTYEVLGDKLVIGGSAPCAAGLDVEVHPVARELLDMTADEYDIRATDTGRAFRLVKHRQGASV
jgi:serine/threonine-protein kinase RsbW